MIAGNNGILNKAGQATEAQKDAEEDEQLKMAVMTAIADDSLARLTDENLRKEITKQFGSDEWLKGTGPWVYEGNKIYDIGTDGNVTTGSEIGKNKVTGTEFTETTEVKDIDGDIVNIPAGFKIAQDSATDDNEGIVIEDKEGN